MEDKAGTYKPIFETRRSSTDDIPKQPQHPKEEEEQQPEEEEVTYATPFSPDHGMFHSI